MSKQNVAHQEFFVIRTPRLPIELFFSLGISSAQTRQEIRRWLDKPEVQEALYFASPSLLARSHDYCIEKGVADEFVTEKRKKAHFKKVKKLEQSLLKYFLRMCTRATPFGLFSGIHCGVVSNETNLRSHALLQDNRKTRIDIFYLSALREYFLKNNIRSQHLIYYANSSHYFVTQQYRYIESYQSNNTRQYRLSEIERNEYFDLVLSAVEHGCTFDKLVNSIYDKYSDKLDSRVGVPIAEFENVTRDEVEDYVEELIKEGVLIANIPLVLTGDSPDHVFTRTLKNINEHDYADHLSMVLHKIKEFDDAILARVSDYQSLLPLLDKLPIKPEENKLFQSDVYRSFENCQLDEALIEQLRDNLLLIKELSVHNSDPFSYFITKFKQRFEGQFVPLNLLLDEESGIGFSDETGYEAPLLVGLELKTNNYESRATKPISLLDRLIERKITLPSNRGAKTIALTSRELSNLSTDSKQRDNISLPSSFSAMFSLFEDSSEQSGTSRVPLLMKFNGCYGPSSANLLGRFCHLDENLKESVRAQLEKEEQHSPDVVFAEVVHMPEGRPGNVIARPHLRKYEIVFLADSSLAKEYQITIDDLYVSVSGHRVNLWSKRLKKQVIPRLSCAHNFSSHSLSTYKFLCLLQYQENSLPNFTLPESQNSASFVPRIMLDNLILSERKWSIERKRLVDLIISDSMGDSAINRDTWVDLVNEYYLDEYVIYAQGDNALHLNLLNPIMLDVLLAETKGQELVELRESLIHQYKTPVKSFSGECYANEIIVPYFNNSAKVYKNDNDNLENNIKAQNTQRRFSPGSEWLSLKVYAGNSAVEALLVDYLFPLIKSNRKLFEKWFFIRYGDPDWHLRLRFYGKREILYGALLPKINELLEPMIRSGQLHKSELFTYEREVERYGGPESIALIEHLFMTDSNLVCNTILLELEGEKDIRWRVALLLTDKLLSAFGHSLEEKLEFISVQRRGFGREFNESNNLRKQLGGKYKEITEQIYSGFCEYKNINTPHGDVVGVKLLSLVELWYQESLPTINKLLDLINSTSEIVRDKNSLLRSILHMHNNRLFKAYGREHELVMYDFLRRYYFSLGKRK